MCLVFGFSPVSINITWVLDDTTKLLDYNTSEPHQGPKGKFSIQSWLRLDPGIWASGVVYTCMVTHTTVTLSLNISKPGASLSIDWDALLPGNHLTCTVAKSYLRDVSQCNSLTVIPEEGAFFDYNMHADVNQDLGEENIYMFMVFTVLFLFLVSIIYNVLVTLIKVRYGSLTV